MAVSEQTPYQEFIANGTTTVFPLNFDAKEQDHLIVLVNDVEPTLGEWSFDFNANQVTFLNPPKANSIIKVRRDTPLKRDASYLTYDNSFRPETVNKDFDLIWMKLQELDVVDWFLVNKIDSLKKYVDDQDDQIRVYWLNEIRKQGVALDQLHEYYDYLMQRLAQISNEKGWDASFVVDGEKNQHQINTETSKALQEINIKGITETISETVDATPFLQSLINAMPNGMTLDLLGKTFRVKKNNGFTEDYPKNDQPCLVIKDKKNITIKNGHLKVFEHGQGIFDVINSTVELSLELEGPGKFPHLFGATGRGEKGGPTAGYFDQQFDNNGFPRNNSVNTSGYKTGNYGENGFPQFDGGYAATWGTWNGGYISNFGDGVYCKNSKVGIVKCKIHGFNGFAVVITEGSLFIEKTSLYGCYLGGTWAKSFADGAGKFIDMYSIKESHIYDMGHPDSRPSDDYADPGYGVSTSNSGTAFQGVLSYVIENNIFQRCKRKAVDAHHSYSLQMHKNLIEDCGSGVQVAIGVTGRAPAFTSITNNHIKKIRYSVLVGAMGISVQPANTTAPFTGSAVISNNIIEDVGMDKSVYDVNKSKISGLGYAIIAGGIEQATITNNSVIIPEGTILNTGISDGNAASNFVPRSTITGNTIRGKMLYGILSRKNSNNSSNILLENSSIVALNTVDIAPRYDLPSSTIPVAIFTDKASLTKNNKIIENQGVQKYYQPNLVDEEVSFEVNVVSGVISNVINSELTNFTVNHFVVKKEDGKLKITVPNYKTFFIVENATPSTANVYGVRYEAGGSTSTSIVLSFYSNLNGSASVIDVNNLTRGSLKITIKLT